MTASLNAGGARPAERHVLLHETALTNRDTQIPVGPVRALPFVARLRAERHLLGGAAMQHRSRSWVIAAAIGALVSIHCGGVDDASGSADRAVGGTDACRAEGGGFCFVQNPEGSKGRGPTSCGEAGLISEGFAHVDSPLHCDVGRCCVPPPAPVACLPFTSKPPTCDSRLPGEAVTFPSRADLEAFLRGSWLLCAFDFFPGSFTDLQGVAFDGAGDGFAVHAITSLDTVAGCSFLNEDKYHRPTQLELIPATPGSTNWLVSFTMPSTGLQTITSIEPARGSITLANGVRLVRVSPAAP